MLAALALSYLHDDLRTRSGASGFPRGSTGAEQPRAQVRTAQMITAPKANSESVQGTAEAQSPRGVAVLVFDAAVSVFNHRRQPANLALCRCCSAQLRNVGDNFAAAENGDDWFRAPVNEPAG